MGGKWSTPADVAAKLNKRWNSGALLSAYSRGEPWQPVAIGLRGPTAREVADDYAAVRRWVNRWEKVQPYRVERKSVGGRQIGANELPAKAVLESYEQAWDTLGVRAEVAEFTDLLDRTREQLPALAEWMLDKPMRVLALRTQWPRMVATVDWILGWASSPALREETYLRELDIPGVDTKFVERHRQVLGELLDLVLPDDDVDRKYSVSEFARRYRFRSKPAYVRFRTAIPVAGATELTVRSDQLDSALPEAAAAFIVENETSYLAMLLPADAVVFFGSGYGVARRVPSDWLAERRVTYWGDIDTHGFTILDRLRAVVPHAESMLMDRQTLLTHEEQWVREPEQANTVLSRLTSVEQQLYQDLIEDALGHSVRLEQERIRFDLVGQAICGTTNHDSGCPCSARKR